MLLKSPFTNSLLNRLKCYLFNAQSIVNKLPELQHIMYNENYDCIFITESWLHSGICDGVIDPRDEYYIMRKDRCSSKGGGVCVLVKRCISVVQVVIPDKYAPVEVMGIDFIGIKPKLQIFAVYRPPYYDVDAVLYM